MKTISLHLRGGAVALFVCFILTLAGCKLHDSFTRARSPIHLKEKINAKADLPPEISSIEREAPEEKGESITLEGAAAAPVTETGLEEADTWGDDFSMDDTESDYDDFSGDDWEDGGEDWGGDDFGESSSSDSKKGGAPGVTAGTLTAGEIRDFSKWELWEDMEEPILDAYRNNWKMHPLHRYSVQLITETGYPVMDQEVVLKNAKNEVIWTSRSDNTGKAELWARPFNLTAVSEGPYSIETVSIATLKKYSLKNAVEFPNGLNFISMGVPCNLPQVADIQFVVDATGSMADEIEFLKAELSDIISRVSTTHAGMQLNLGSVFYRDYEEKYLTRVSPLSKDASQVVNFIQNQRADGGGDFPEAVDEALEVALKEGNWSPRARARILFLILDAPPHGTAETIERIHTQAALASKMGIRIIPVTASGITIITEFLMRSLALTTNGTYTFLTDHSGVGGSHIEPTTDSYDVEKLNDLMVRLIDEYVSAPECTLPTVSETTTTQDTILLSHLKAEISDAANTQVSPAIAGAAAALPDLHFKYYPNPTAGMLKVEVSNTSGELYLADVRGKMLKRYAVTDEKVMELDLSAYPKGIYFLTWHNEIKSLTGKLLVR